MTLRFMDLSSIDDYVIPLSYQSFFTFHFYSLTIFTVNHYFPWLGAARPLILVMQLQTQFIKFLKESCLFIS